MSKISNDGIAVKTSGIDEKLLFFRFRYLRRDKSAKAVGRVVSRLYPSVILREDIVIDLARKRRVEYGHT